MAGMKRIPSEMMGGLLILGLAGFLAGRAVLRRRRKMDVAGQVALITGGSRGLGLEIARELASKGAKIAICARNERELRDAQEQLEAKGADVLAVTCDVTRVEDVGNVVQQTIDRFGQIDILVNSAGTIAIGPMSHLKLEDYRRVMEINFFGSLNTMLAVLPEMRRRREGRIVNIASFGGEFPAPHAAAYNASKHAVVGLSHTFREELVNNGVYVTTVNPGFIRNGSMVNAVFKGDHEAEKALAMTVGNAPLVSIDPQRMAKRIINALEHGDAELTTPTLPRFHGAFPGLSQEIMSLVNRLLPHRSPDGDELREGADISDRKVPLWARARAKAGEEQYQSTNPRTT
jgi:NAD(P)-dependent dehydrogenase (short-subunit alcohol dehydrogenase family)